MKTENNLGEILAAIPTPNAAPDDVPTQLDARDIQRRCAEFASEITALCEGVGRLPQGDRRSRLAQCVADVQVLVGRLVRAESLAGECDRVASSWAGNVLLPLVDGDARDALERLTLARARRQHAEDLRTIYAAPLRAGIVALIEHVRAELAAVPKVEPVTSEGSLPSVRTARERRGGGVAVS